ncbi:MAG: cupredoxin domain-containing protein [Actinomycetota bacterium]|nr:cupredoxin domain-containing protein [Actinomycetota bacterium]
MAYVADPEQIYQEVLQEEQGKGVSGAVAEGRAKSARARAEAGSPHPKEPKWWPGAQPHLEGGGDEGEAEEPAEEVAEEPAAEAEPEAPAAEAPAAEAPAATEEQQAPEVEQEQQAPPPAPAEAPAQPAAPAAAPPAPAEQPAAAATAQPEAAPAQPAAAAATAQQPTPTTGVTHGTSAGTRLRPEDAISTEAQFQGQEAMYERRKLIDDLVATGVPAVTANETARPRSPMLALLYLIIPLLVIGYLAGQEGGDTEAGASETATEGEAPAEGGEGGEGGPTSEITAADLNWDTDTITLAAGEANDLTVVNEDAVVHNLSIYPDADAASAQENELFKGPDVPGGSSGDYTIEGIKAGTYTFICDYHANMIGEAVVE